MIVSYLDFKAGKYELHTGMYDQARIQDYIDLYEKPYLIKLLGAELFDEFEADFIAGIGIPTEVRFQKILNPFHEDYNFQVIISEGMKEMLLGLIYFEYAKDLSNQMTNNGLVKPVGENSKNISSLNAMYYTRFNRSVRTWRAIQCFIYAVKSEDYSNRNGQPLQYAYWI
tara:strand:+ start:648 stop:1157 length:510 start_codon:yes stop_codon:yes gene_type:complete